MMASTNTTRCLHRMMLPLLAGLMLMSTATAQQAAAEQCNSTLLAIGSFSNVTYIEPPVSGEGVTILNLTLCSTAQGNITATLIQDRLIPIAEAGMDPSYCDQYTSDSIFCSNGFENGTATLLNVSTAGSETFALGGVQPTHIEVLSSGIVAIASYGGGSFLTFDPGLPPTDAVVSFATIPEANATKAAGNPERQEAPHPHQVLEVAQGEVLIPDLGSDAVWQYNVSDNGTLTWAGATTVPAGSGPRHAAVGPAGKVYVAAELSLQLLELGGGCGEGAEGAARGVCSSKDVAATALNSTFTSAAAIRVSGDQRFVYMSLRADEATPDLGGVVGFALTQNGSVGDWAGTWSTGGQQPRDFNLVEVPGFREVFVMANRKSNDVVVFDRDVATGAVGAQLASAAVNSPVSVLAIEQAADTVSSGAAAAAAAPAAVPEGQAAGAPVGTPDDVLGSDAAGAPASAFAPANAADAAGSVFQEEDVAPEAAAGDSAATREAGLCAAGETAGESGECETATAPSSSYSIADAAADCVLFAAVAVYALFVGLGGAVQ